jgi:hypothetical protein
MFLDSDDIAAEYCIAQRIEAANAKPDADITVFPAMTFREVPGDENVLWNVVTDEPELHRFMRLDAPWQGTGPLWKKTAFVSLGGWDESLAVWQDVDLSMRALDAKISHSIRYDLPPDVYLRRGSGNTISSSSLYSPRKLESKRRVLHCALDIAEEKNLETADARGRKGSARALAFSVIRDHACGGLFSEGMKILAECTSRGFFTFEERALISLDTICLAPIIRRVPGAKAMGRVGERRFSREHTIGRISARS